MARVTVTRRLRFNAAHRVFNPSLSDAENDEVVNAVDHRNFNLDVPFMRDRIPTSENIIVAFWKILEPAIAPAHLVRLVLWETENNYVEYSGS
jgi:6-pyruvoyltetrahydropterin/6-carboxytetrahydropterin synthase